MPGKVRFAWDTRLRCFARDRRADAQQHEAPSRPSTCGPVRLCSRVLPCSKGCGEARGGCPKPRGLRPTGRGARAVQLKQKPPLGRERHIWGPGAGPPLCPGGVETAAVPGAPAVPSRDVPAPGRERPWPPATASGRTFLSPHHPCAVNVTAACLLRSCWSTNTRETRLWKRFRCVRPALSQFREERGAEQVTRRGGGSAPRSDSWDALSQPGPATGLAPVTGVAVREISPELLERRRPDAPRCLTRIT